MHMIRNTISRIEKMEQYFDEILEAKNSNPHSWQNDCEMQEKLQELIKYYESGLWLHDYECDERGELPEDFKRGVLSEDGLYNLICELEEAGA